MYGALFPQKEIKGYWKWYRKSKRIKNGRKLYIWWNKNNFGIQTPFGLLHYWRPPNISKP